MLIPHNNPVEHVTVFKVLPSFDFNQTAIVVYLYYTLNNI